MNEFEHSSCTMSPHELDQASRAHFEFTASLLKEIQARRAATSQNTSNAQASRLDS